MTDKEFENQNSTITVLNNQIDTLKKELSSKSNEMGEDMKSFIDIITQRNSNFSKYISLLKEFNFSDNLTSPSDLFVGIRTTSDMANPEELKQKTDVMKTCANGIDSCTKQLDILSNKIVKNLKYILSVVIETSQLENEYYDLSLDLVKDMNSVYDVGQLSKMS